jgi:hypothetical protein
MTAMGGELFVSDPARGTIVVFSFAGDCLRQIRGDWTQPNCLIAVGEHLYMTEIAPWDDEFDSWMANSSCTTTDGTGDPAIGRRIYTLSPAGETLRVWTSDHHDTHPRGLWMYFFALTHFSQRLLAVRANYHYHIG